MKVATSYTITDTAEYDQKNTQITPKKTYAP